MRSVMFAATLVGIGLSSASAAVLDAGAGQAYASPSAAIRAAHDGDTVRVHPGQYFDCAIVRQSNITIEGVGDGAVLTDNACNGKALLITNGNNVTIRNLTLQRVRVPDGNGAGIRAQGGNLTVDNVRFLDDQEGILAGSNPAVTIRVLRSTFIKDGYCIDNSNDCGHGIYVNRVAELDVEQSRFFDIQHTHSIKSRAMMTRVVNCDIQDGPDGTSSYQIDVPNGGSVIVERNILQKGPHAENWSIAISIGEGGVKNPTNEILVRDNVFINDTGHPTTFVKNLTATPAQLSNNTFRGGTIRPLLGDGSVH